MKEKMEMTPRERFMTACRNQQPDRVPAVPDISFMIPCRLTGKPSWEVHANKNPPLWKAYLEAVKFFGMEGWFTDWDFAFRSNSQVTGDSKLVKYDDRWESLYTLHTPDGDLHGRTVYPNDNPPVTAEKLIKDLEKDFMKVRHLFPEITGFDRETYEHQKRELGDLGMMTVFVGTPGLHSIQEYFEGGLETATYAYYDYPELMEELFELMGRNSVRMTELAVDAGVDSIHTGGSGSITLQSPELWRKLALPTLKKITKMCREAGVISGVHSCGKARYLIETCANETHLDYVNPLELPPLGDCTLKDCKESAGDRLALMGNLHTTDVMLFGSVERVELESLRAIRDAGMNGGFILSTGDQCGRDTPLENIHTLVRTAREYGRYPLDMDRIGSRIEELERMLGEAP